MALLLLRFVVLVVLFALVVHYMRRMGRGGKRGPKLSAYEILGISANASASEIKEAYHRELANYHPDKVAHLGEDLQVLARAKTVEIIEAYHQLKR